MLYQQRPARALTIPHPRNCLQMPGSVFLRHSSNFSGFFLIFSRDGSLKTRSPPHNNAGSYPMRVSPGDDEQGSEVVKRRPAPSCTASCGGGEGAPARVTAASSMSMTLLAAATSCRISRNTLIWSPAAVTPAASARDIRS